MRQVQVTFSGQGIQCQAVIGGIGRHANQAAGGKPADRRRASRPGANQPKAPPSSDQPVRLTSAPTEVTG
jgi:hypothetical protein